MAASEKQQTGGRRLRGGEKKRKREGKGHRLKGQIIPGLTPKGSLDKGKGPQKQGPEFTAALSSLYFAPINRPVFLQLLPLSPPTCYSRVTTPFLDLRLSLSFNSSITPRGLRPCPPPCRTVSLSLYLPPRNKRVRGRVYTLPGRTLMGLTQLDSSTSSSLPILVFTPVR